MSTRSVTSGYEPLIKGNSTPAHLGNKILDNDMLIQLIEKTSSPLVTIKKKGLKLDFINQSVSFGPPVGIQNPGNACYINSALQVFLSAPHLLKKAIPYSTPAFQKILAQYQSACTQGNLCVLNLQTLAVPKGEHVDTQQDAAEGFNNFLQRAFSGSPFDIDLVHRTFYAGMYQHENADQMKGCGYSTLNKDEFQNVLPEDGTYLFMKEDRGRGLPLLTLSCRDEQHVCELLKGLSAETPRFAHSNYISFEELDGYVMCAGNTTTRLKESPDTLILNMARSQRDGTVSRSLANFGQENRISVPGACFDQTEDVSYRIVGCINHSGIKSTSGHYISCVARFNPMEQRTLYYTVNDAQVTELSWEKFKDYVERSSLVLLEKNNLPQKSIESLLFPKTSEHIALFSGDQILSASSRTASIWGKIWSVPSNLMQTARRSLLWSRGLSRT